jgi:hypothetical protein
MVAPSRLHRQTNRFRHRINRMPKGMKFASTDADRHLNRNGYARTPVEEQEPETVYVNMQIHSEDEFETKYVNLYIDTGRNVNIR